MKEIKLENKALTRKRNALLISERDLKNEVSHYTS